MLQGTVSTFDKAVFANFAATLVPSSQNRGATARYVFAQDPQAQGTHLAQGILSTSGTLHLRLTGWDATGATWSRGVPFAPQSRQLIFLQGLGADDATFGNFGIGSEFLNGELIWWDAQRELEVSQKILGEPFP